MITMSVKKKLLAASGEFTLQADIKIDKGEIVSFFGTSGTGKTTLLRIIAGLTDPEEGLLRVEDREWFNTYRGANTPPENREVGFVFQNYALFPNMNVRENISFAQPRKDKRHADHLLELLDLTNLQHRKPYKLSGGQQQRVALARALARKPSILLLDEPLSALDNEMRCMLQDEIKQINKLWGITTILVSHDLPEIVKLCSRVFSFKDGIVTDNGNAFDIIGDSKISGKVQFIADVLKVEKEDVVQVITLLVGNSPVKVALCDMHDSYSPGDRVLIASKAFNPIIQKI